MPHITVWWVELSCENVTKSLKEAVADSIWVYLSTATRSAVVADFCAIEASLPPVQSLSMATRYGVVADFCVIEASLPPVQSLRIFFCSLTNEENGHMK